MSTTDGAADATEAKTATEQIDQGFVILETNYKLYAYTGILDLLDMLSPYRQLMCLYRFTTSNCRIKFVCATAISI